MATIGTTRKSEISTKEAHHLATLEKTIEEGLQTFVEVGEALQEIRDKRLYRNAYERFEDYCRDRWGMGRSYANRQINGSKVIAELGPDLPKPRNEATARALVPFLESKDELRAAWQEARQLADAEDREPSAEDVIDTDIWKEHKQRRPASPKKKREQPERAQSARIIEAVGMVVEVQAKIYKIDLDRASDNAPPQLRDNHLEILRGGDEAILDLMVALDADEGD